MMHPMTQAANQPWMMQEVPVGDVLHDIMAYTHQDHIADEAPGAQMLHANESQPSELHEHHGRQQKKDLIEKDARQDLAISEPRPASHLGAIQTSGPIAPFEAKPDPVKGHHLDRPDKNRQRKPTQQHAIRHIEPSSKPTEAT
jgi:hypothetical protein